MSLWKREEEAKRLAFEAIDGLLAIDVSKSSMILVDNYPILETILLARGTNVPDALEALITSYKSFGHLRADRRREESCISGRAGAIIVVPDVIVGNKELVYSKLLNDEMFGGVIIRQVCNQAEECSCCTKDDNF
ncbi:unnamed protein product [Arabidopsis halleri]